MQTQTTVSQITTVPFHGQDLALLFTADNRPMVAIKPICENMGLQWEPQRKRIQRDSALNSVASMMEATATDGKTYEFTCLPLDYLNGWLFGIDEKRIKNPETRQRVLQYKRECYRVLSDYWLHGQANNPRQQNAVPESPEQRQQEQLSQWVQDQRWLLFFDNGKATMKAVDPGAAVVPMSQWPEVINEMILPDDALLARIATACTSKLEARANYRRKLAEANRLSNGQ